MDSRDPVTTCGGVSVAHGSNDGQKGMGLIMLVLDRPLARVVRPESQGGARGLARRLGRRLSLKVRLMSYERPLRPSRPRARLDDRPLDGKDSLREVPLTERWHIRSAIFHVDRLLGGGGRTVRHRISKTWSVRVANSARRIEYVPTWVVVGVALCLGIGTTIGYQRIVITVAEKIGKTHLTYAQGACAELVAMATIGLADVGGLPVSTTHVLSFGRRRHDVGEPARASSSRPSAISLWPGSTLPASMLISALLFTFGRLALGKLIARLRAILLLWRFFVTWESCHAFSLSGDEPFLEQAGVWTPTFHTQAMAAMSECLAPAGSSRLSGSCGGPPLDSRRSVDENGERLIAQNESAAAM